MSASNVATTECCASSPLPPRPAARAGARPSSSSKKMMEGALALASSKRLPRAFSASPTYFERQSAPFRTKNATPLLLASALSS